MLRTALPVCLLVALLAASAPAAPAAKPAQAALAGWSPQEKLALAWLGQIGGKDAAKARIARRRFATLPAKAKLRPLAQALRCEPARLRAFAAEALGGLGERAAVRPLLFRVVREPDRAVRKALVRALRAIDDPGAVHVLGRALSSRDAARRARAAEALVLLGDELACAYFVARWEGRAGDFPRVYVSVASQRSYIQDFDVEVASTSFIADPIVGVLQEATSFGVKVVATEQIEYQGAVRTWRGGLEALSGERLGSKVAAWRAWWDRNEARVLKARAARYAEPDEA